MLTGTFEKPAIIPYTSPVEIDTTSTIYAFAKNDADEKSLITKGTFYKTHIRIGKLKSILNMLLNLPEEEMKQLLTASGEKRTGAKVNGKATQERILKR